MVCYFHEEMMCAYIFTSSYIAVSSYQCQVIQKPLRLMAEHDSSYVSQIICICDLILENRPSCHK